MTPNIGKLEREWPQKVRVRIPPGGFGWRFPHLMWAARNCGSPRHWQEGEALSFAFYDEVDTASFRDWMKKSAIAWDWPVEWPQIEPAPPLGASDEVRAAQRFDPEAMSDWIRDALRRGHARRVMSAFLRGNRSRAAGGGFGAYAEATRELAELRPDLDPALHRPMVDALREWTRRNHGKWFADRLQAHARQR